VQVDFVNPFTSSLNIRSIKSTIKSHGMTLGSIDQEVDFPVSGKATARSPRLDLNMNLDPAQIFTLTIALAKEAGLRTDQVSIEHLDTLSALISFDRLKPSCDWEVMPPQQHLKDVRL
jgi:hypothetical protein